MPLLPFALEFTQTFAPINPPKLTFKFNVLHTLNTLVNSQSLAPINPPKLTFKSNVLHTLNTLVNSQSPLISLPAVPGPVDHSFLLGALSSLASGHHPSRDFLYLLAATCWLLNPQTCKGGNALDLFSPLVSLCPLIG